MNSPPKMASTVTILGTKCSRPWAGKREKVLVATSRASLHQLRYKFKNPPSGVGVRSASNSINGCLQSSLFSSSGAAEDKRSWTWHKRHQLHPLCFRHVQRRSPQSHVCSLHWTGVRCCSRARMICCHYWQMTHSTASTLTVTGG